MATLEEIVAKTVEAFGRIDVLVCMRVCKRESEREREYDRLWGTGKLPKQIYKI